MNNIENHSRIVILGGAGFIGFHVAKFLYQSCTSIIILVDNFINSKKDSEFLEFVNLERVIFKELDLSREEDYLDLFLEGDIVLNCAAFNGTQNFYEKPVDVVRNSSLPAILAPELCAKANVAKYIYLGSSESYAGGVSIGFTKVPTNEKVPLVIQDVNNARWSYAASKTMGEVATIANHIQNNLQYFILRIHNIYGPRMGFNHVIPDLIRKFSLGNMQVHGVKETRSFFYVTDLNIILYNLIFSQKVTINSIYNVGSSEEISISNLAKLIRNELQLNFEIEPINSLEGSVPRRCPDTRALRAYIDFPETSLVDGIKKTILWYQRVELLN